MLSLYRSALIPSSFSSHHLPTKSKIYTLICVLFSVSKQPTPNFVYFSHYWVLELKQRSSVFFTLSREATSHHLITTHSAACKHIHPLYFLISPEGWNRAMLVFGDGGVLSGAGKFVRNIRRENLHGSCTAEDPNVDLTHTFRSSGNASGIIHVPAYLSSVCL